MRYEDQDELFEKIERSKNNDFELEYSEQDYREKYSKDIEDLHLELDHAIDRARKRRAI